MRRQGKNASTSSQLPKADKGIIEGKEIKTHVAKHLKDIIGGTKGRTQKCGEAFQPRHVQGLFAGRRRDPFGRQKQQPRPGLRGAPGAKAMAPRLQLEKAAWRWAETVRREEGSQEHIETTYRIWLEPCIRCVCRRNCKGNPDCLVGTDPSLAPTTGTQ
ncbi:ras-related protein Rab-39B isoform X3 [Heterocephalus glaber]|uniref:Ras-related protein Rab-39B isoform X3 n=1 Tax=Heterocephalus glaber TaxID=10181 RepID=A0AAX6SJQ3_HETGA|nr:ras-related protein Rab-39B isoform X3 [Heterocephalus glaber]